PMSSVRETALQALFTVLQGVAGVSVKRNEILPVKVPDNGLIILFDGDVTVAETLLSPLRYLIQHRAEVQVAVQKPAASARDAALDAILTSIAAAIVGNPRLNSTVDIAMLEASQVTDEPIEGAAGLKIASIPVLLEYIANTPIS
ncbi:MAG: acyl-CoA transferase, partial [Alphaproteobacteria bacterium]